jgi:formylglycine-generating enzyme required for sulfatase activity
MHAMKSLVLAFCLILTAGVVSAQSRVALVLGNGAYVHAPGLPNPTADATEVGSALERLGFDVLLRTDQTAAGMRAAVRDFSIAMEGAELALFFYAGHGIQVGGRNYLIPVDADVEREADVDLATIPLDLILAQMDRSSATRIVFLDACRNNPFEGRLARSMGQSRAVGALGNGLAPIETDGGTFVGYATDPGEVAFDGTGRHSPFTASLLQHIEQPGLEINTLMTRVRADVFQNTDRLQRPWSSSSLLNEVYLAPSEPVEEPKRTLDPRLVELAAWEQVQSMDTAAAYQAYLDTYPDGLFRQMAEAQLSALTAAPEPETEVAALAPQPEPITRSEPQTPIVRPTARPTPAPAPEPVGVAEPEPERARPTLVLVTPLNEDCPACPRTLRIPGGETVLGSDYSSAERPRMPQTIAPFYMSAAEITVGEMRRFEEATGQRIRRSCFVWTQEGRLRSRDGAYWGAPGFDVTDDHPAACINWDDAQAYVAWLNSEDPNGGWRLPTEAEFEYATRAGTVTSYPWEGGAEALCRQVNGAGAESMFRHRNRACDDGYATPVPANVFPVNAFGLSHMIGNLWEWTADCWNGSHRGASPDGSARTSGNCDSRVLRGGSWDDPAENLRAAYRVAIPKNRRQANVGFRVARDVK